jgi:hypothetical protein
MKDTFLIRGLNRFVRSRQAHCRSFAGFTKLKGL